MGAALGGGGQKRGGGGGGANSGGGGSTKGGGVSTSKNRPSHHKYKYKSPRQFELKQTWKALRAHNARWALPVYPVFEDEKSKGVRRKIGQAKNRIKKTDRTNIIATNFVWEQLKTFDSITFSFPNTFSELSEEEKRSHSRMAFYP